MSSRLTPYLIHEQDQKPLPGFRRSTHMKIMFGSLISVRQLNQQTSAKMVCYKSQVVKDLLQKGVQKESGAQLFLLI